jgi:hypothetical protein
MEFTRRSPSLIRSGLRLGLERRITARARPRNFKSVQQSTVQAMNTKAKGSLTEAGRVTGNWKNAATAPSLEGRSHDRDLWLCPGSSRPRFGPRKTSYKLIFSLKQSPNLLYIFSILSKFGAHDSWGPCSIAQPARAHGRPCDEAGTMHRVNHRA